MNPEQDWTLVNLTPHPITLVTAEGGELVLPPAAEPARCSMERRVVGRVRTTAGNVPLHRVVAGPAEGLPTPRPGVLCIVSRIVAESVTDRTDLVVPDVSVRGESGGVLAAEGLAVNGEWDPLDAE
jgi:hypothetical protein